VKKSRPSSESCPRPAGGRPSPSFLLAQVGAHAASQFAARLAKLKLAPRHAGILRILNSTSAITQQALAAILGIVPSRLVAFLDEMEGWGLVERRENCHDRRRYALHITEKGRTTVEMIGRVAREHSQSLLAAISDDEQRQLAILLQRIADQQGLTRGVHPGYRDMAAENSKSIQGR
jgi:DNA-binding MarR family transcriptional regulator